MLRMNTNCQSSVIPRTGETVVFGGGLKHSLAENIQVVVQILKLKKYTQLIKLIND